MSKVIQLSDSLIRLIAAGEVIAEPVSVVKEAIENSIDAGANEIQVDITNGGISSIIVSDNGSGIDIEDLKVITSRHCTSKIKTEEDLIKILTLGFRGEFLASLLAAADLIIITKEKSSDRAYKAAYSVGNKPVIEPTSRITGTTLLVNNLFDKIPARRNFLPKPKTSSARIFENIRQFSLAYEKIRFIFRSDNKEKFRSQPGTKLNAITMIFGSSTTKNLLSINTKSDDGRWFLEGFISTPSEIRANRSSQYFFLNGRIIENTIIEKAVEDGYGNFIAPRKFPVVVLYLRGPPEDYDANVHPTKKEIRLKSESMIYEFIQKSVYLTLMQNTSRSIQTFSQNKDNISQITFDQLTPNQSIESFGTKNKNKNFLNQKFKLNSNTEFDDTNTSNNIDDFDLEQIETGEQVKNPIEDSLQYFYGDQRGRMGDDFFQHVVNKEEIKDLIPIFQFEKTFILAVQKQNPEHIYIIDQHAVAERITLEKIVYSTKNIIKQVLLEPIEILLSPEEEEILIEIFSLITKHGYSIEVKNNLTILVTAFPIYQSKKFSKNESIFNLREILADSIALKNQKGGLSNSEQEIIKSLACHNSIKAGYILNHQDMSDLLHDMIQAKFPFVCCHGRPSIFKLSNEKLYKLFWRT